jgi:uncharacterized protein YoxC
MLPDMVTNILLGILILGVGIVGWTIVKKSAAPAFNDRDELKNKIDELQKDIKVVESKRDEFAGKNKQLFSDKEKLQAKLDAQEAILKDQEKKITRFEAKKEQDEKMLIAKMDELTNATKSFEDEKARVRREDEERLAEMEEERDRMWNDHENVVNALLTELCSKPEYRFVHFTNTKLPKGFDASLKPDFLIEFLGQYIIFDSKATKSNDLKTYIRDTVKKTAQKMKGRSEIYGTIFFVVPTAAISSLRETTYHENGYVFHVITPEALAPILAILKRMSEYEFAEKFDPEERENFVKKLATFEHHIQTRNAFDVSMAHIGSELIAHQQSLDPELAQEIEMKKHTMKPVVPSKSDVERLTANNLLVQSEVQNLISPKARIEKKTIRKTVEAVEMEFEA